MGKTTSGQLMTNERMLSRRNFLKAGGAAGVAAGAGLLGAAPTTAQPAKGHNILFILTDDQGVWAAVSNRIRTV